MALRFGREWDQFDRGLEKAVSISAGIASAAFTLARRELQRAAGVAATRPWQEMMA
jgi:hypothetical protein